MAKYVSKDGKHTTSTTNPAERVSLLNQGYREQKDKPAAPPASKSAQAADKK